jgi:hypothetical protein
VPPLADVAELGTMDDWPVLYTDAEWRKACRARMAELGVGQGTLSVHLTGTDTRQSTISTVLGEKDPPPRSSYVLPLSVALGVELPPMAQLERIYLQRPDRRFFEAILQLIKISGVP